jgi:hypothetical protein
MIIPTEQRRFRGPDGQWLDRITKFDPVYGSVPESDEETIARYARAAADEAEAKQREQAREANGEAALERRMKEALRVLTMPVIVGGQLREQEPSLDAANVHLAKDFLLPALDAEEALRVAREPVEAAQREADQARKALRLTATSGLARDASLEEIMAAQRQFREETDRLDALDERARHLERTIPEELVTNARVLRERAEKATEDRKAGRLRAPRPPSAVFVWSEEDRNYLAHHLHVDADAASNIYGSKWGVGLESGRTLPKWRELYSLAGLPTAGVRFTDDEQPSGWYQDDQDFHRKLSHALRAGLGARFNLDPEAGAKIRKQAQQWGPQSSYRLGVTT